MSSILALDQALFEAINGRWTLEVFDLLMPLFHRGYIWLVLLGLLGLLIAWRSSGPTRRVLLVAAIALLVVDQTNARLLKPLLGRLRPCHALEGVRLLVTCGGLYSLPSGHAANAAALAVTLGARFRGALVLLLLLAAFVGYSRIYVGVHYPSDVVVGWLWGALAGIGGAVAFRLWERRSA